MSDIATKPVTTIPVQAIANAIVKDQKAQIEKDPPKTVVNFSFLKNLRTMDSYAWDLAPDLFKEATEKKASKRSILERDPARRGFPPFRLETTMYTELAKNVRSGLDAVSGRQGDPATLTRGEINSIESANLRNAAQKAFDAAKAQSR